jgi:hypothetical protein
MRDLWTRFMFRRHLARGRAGRPTPADLWFVAQPAALCAAIVLTLHP